MSTTHATSMLFDEIAGLFASAPSADQIARFKPSQRTIDRASELLELNRRNELSSEQREELNQFEQAELLMRVVKARIRADQVGGRTAR